MPTFEVTLRDRTVETVDGADAYQQEGPMTTFFRRGDGRDVIDSWSTRMASFRTADLLVVRRCEQAAACGRSRADGRAVGPAPAVQPVGTSAPGASAGTPARRTRTRPGTTRVSVSPSAPTSDSHCSPKVR